MLKPEPIMEDLGAVLRQPWRAVSEQHSYYLVTYLAINDEFLRAVVPGTDINHRKVYTSLRWLWTHGKKRFSIHIIEMTGSI
jgi:hypothetical protein